MSTKLSKPAGCSRPGSSERAALDAERLELHDRALGPASEGGRLLELLEDQQRGHSVEQSPAAAQPIAAPDNAARPGLLPPSAPPRGQDERHQAASTMQTRSEVAR